MIALTSIKGIGRQFANIVYNKADVNMNIVCKTVSDKFNAHTFMESRDNRTCSLHPLPHQVHSVALSIILHFLLIKYNRRRNSFFTESCLPPPC
ncbi:hypothetical protein KSP40_PGU020950 [Platanthera guangdongensis]|uniref:Ribosomal protein S11 n=1 Tax=Platanthera guangdongensis TaxID=2320717 RepID=A0ABR2LZP2_9ASPA